MKKQFASFFLFVFISFIAVPSVVVLIDESVDVSFAYMANEEENSKHHVELQLTLDNLTHDETIFYLQEQDLIHYYSDRNHLVYLDVLSPPTQTAYLNFAFSGHTEQQLW